MPLLLSQITVAPQTRSTPFIDIAARSTSIALLTLLISPLACFASENWEITVKSTPIDSYLKDPGSSLKSMVKLAVAYMPANDPAHSRPYETLYYSNNLPVGCNRHGALDLQAGSAGMIRVTNSSSQPLQASQCLAVANAAGRLFLDLSVRRCIVYSVVVPRDSFTAMMSAFYAAGFHGADSGQPSAAALNIVSEPAGQSAALYY